MPIEVVRKKAFWVSPTWPPIPSLDEVRTTGVCCCDTREAVRLFIVVTRGELMMRARPVEVSA